MNIELKKIKYFDIELDVLYDTNDKSGMGAINEIVNLDEYILNQFRDQENKIFIDIGANIGIATLIMAKLNPKSTIYSFEPYTKVFNIMKMNIELNNLNNVKLFNVGISSKNQDNIKLNIYNEWSGASSMCADDDIFESYYKEDSAHTYISCVSFDEMIVRHNINDIYLLKIDCEGAEYDIIYGSERFKNRIIKNMVGEFHDLKYNKTPQNECEKLLQYSKQYIDGVLQINFFNK